MAKRKFNNFTDKALDNLKPEKSRYEVSDGSGLRVRVSPTGVKSFVWYHLDKRTGKNVGVTIGRYPDISLSHARKQLKAMKKSHQAGEVISDKPVTVAELAELYYTKKVKDGLKRPDAIRQVLDHDIIPGIGTRRLTEITKLQINAVIDAAVDRGARSHANKIMTTLKGMFRWADVKGYVASNPMPNAKASDFSIVTSNPRDRFLDAENQEKPHAQLTEIPEFWHALDTVKRLSFHVKTGLRLLLLTGVRTGELLQAEWSEIDFDKMTWTIPVAHQKIKPAQMAKARDFVVPLSHQALALFAELKAVNPARSKFVMPGKPVDGEYIQPIEDKVMARAVRRMFERMILTMPHFTPHDLRRTLRSHLSGICQPHIAELCLNHSLGSVFATYDLSSYMVDRRNALQTWADKVDRAVNPVENVVEFSA
jgi:integrase